MLIARLRALLEPSMTRKNPDELRSHRWYGVQDLRSFGHRSRMKQMGLALADFAGKPVIAVVNTWNGLAHCHAHFPNRVQDIQRGVLEAGGFPVEISAMALPENFVKPTTMLYRNFLAMEVEESLRSLPIDGAVLMGGCDKTTASSRDGGYQRRFARDLHAGGAHAAGELARQDPWVRQRHLEVLGREACRKHQRGRMG